MKVMLLCVALLAISTAPMSAAVIACDDPTLGGTGSSNNITFSYSVWTAAGFTCQQQDKIYSGFTHSGLPTDTSLQLILQAIGPLEFHTVNFLGDFTGVDFTSGFNIAIDPAVLDRVLVQVRGDIQNIPGTGSPSNLKEVSGAGGFTGSLTSTTASGGIPIAVPNLLYLDVTDTFTSAGGGVTAVGNTFIQQNTALVPEPASMLLLGSGLLGLAVMARRRISSK
jgi:hypothetical protein